MTVLSPISSISYFGDGFTSLFFIPFYFISDDHIRVQIVTAGTVTAMIEGVDYTLLGAGDLHGGTIQTTVPVPSISTLDIDRILPIIQEDDYVAHNVFPAETMEKDLDYLTMICQQLSDQIGLLAGGGAAINFAMIGSGAGVYAGASGITQLFKRIQGAGATTVTETSSQITISSSSGTSGVDLAADYPWTGHHTWSRQALRTVPAQVMKSLGVGDIVDGGILLANDYVALLDMRKTTNVALNGPVDASYGGDFLIYGQHKMTGTANNLGYAGGGIRMQAETSAVRTFGSPGAVAGYFSVNNLGTDQGAFGVHTDAYHSGTFGGFAHSTYGLSAEVWKNIAGGVAAGAVLRSMSTQPLDWGLHILHNGGSAGFNRGIQLGSPLVTNGGIPGGTGTLTPFTVGIDMSWGQYTNGQAISIKANDYIILSAQAQAQTATPINVCALRWNSATGNFQVSAFGTEFFGVNMTNGIIYQNGQPAIAFFETTRPYVFQCVSAGGKNSQTIGPAGTAAALPALPFTYLKIIIDGNTYKIPCYSPGIG